MTSCRASIRDHLAQRSNYTHAGSEARDGRRSQQTNRSRSYIDTPTTVFSSRPAAAAKRFKASYLRIVGIQVALSSRIRTPAKLDFHIVWCRPSTGGTIMEIRVTVLFILVTQFHVVHSAVDKPHSKDHRLIYLILLWVNEKMRIATEMRKKSNR